MTALVAGEAGADMPLPPKAYERIDPCLCNRYLLSAEHCSHVKAGIPICPQCVDLIERPS